MGDPRLFLPPDWADDEIMDVMFSPFRGSRDVNPRSWDSKLKFWTDMIRSYCVHEKTCVVDRKSLPHKFLRKGKLPVCLDVVLQELKIRGKLQTLSDFRSSLNNSWASWTYGMLVRKPASWTYDMLVKKPMQWTTAKVFGTEPSSSENLNEQLVDVELVKAMAADILQCHHESVQNALTDALVEYKQLQQLSSDLCPDPLYFQLAVLQLCEDGKCSLKEITPTEKLVKFVHEDEGIVPTANDSDVRIYRLKTSQDVLEKQILDLTDEMEKCRQEAKSHLAEGRKSQAKNCLKRKKRLEQLRDNKDTALDNLQHMLTLIQQLDANKMIVDAYKSGNQLFKEMTQRYGLTTDMIDDAMAEIQEVKDMSDDINASMSQPVDPLEPSLEDLESELDHLLAGGGDPRQEVRYPSPPRGQPAMPHQEMVDAMCRMKVKTDTFDDLDLPEAPTYEPGSPLRPAVSSPAKRTAVPEKS